MRVRRTDAPAGDASPAFPAPHAGDAPEIAPAQILAALARRRERRGETVAEVAAALAALAAAVERHAGMVEDVRRAVEAQGGDLAPLQFYDSLMARFRSELRAAERTLADAFRVAARDSAAPA
jgi:hypothetical protein